MTSDTTDAMKQQREERIRNYMRDIRRAAEKAPYGAKCKIINKLQKISIELKRDRDVPV